MTVEIATTAGNGVARALPGVMPDVTSEALDRLARWVDAASHAHKLVAPLVGTPWVPEAYQPKVPANAPEEDKRRAYDVAVANATAAVLYGSSLGIDPLMALQQVYVVHGRPGLYAKMMVALVQSRGHEVWTEDLTDTRAVVCGKRRGSSHTERVTITMEMARKGGWTRNPKYGDTPQDMLWARAAGRVCDRIASDVLKGIATVEQIEDEAIQATAEVGTRTVAPPRKRTAVPAPAIAALPEEPPLDEEPAAAPAALGADAANLTGLMKDVLNQLGLTGWAEHQPYIVGIIDREVKKASDLTEAEKRKVITAAKAKLAAAADAPALDDNPPFETDQPELS